MRKLLHLVALSLLFVGTVAHADGPTSVTGAWAGIAAANPLVDLNADGNGARVFDVHAFGQLRFTALQGVVDTALVAVPGQPSNACPNPNAEFELEPYGTVIFRGWTTGAIFTEVDSSHHLCFDPTNPSELMKANIIFGTGAYAGVTGTAEFTLHDIVISANEFGFPLVVDTQGEFRVTFE